MNQDPFKVIIANHISHDGKIFLNALVEQVTPSGSATDEKIMGATGKSVSMHEYSLGDGLAAYILEDKGDNVGIQDLEECDGIEVVWVSGIEDARSELTKLLMERQGLQQAEAGRTPE